MRGTRARRSGDVLFGSTGWLFADLMLAVVVMLFLGVAISASTEPASQPPPTPAATTTTTTTTTTPPVTTTPPRPPALLPKPIEQVVFVDTAALLRTDPGVIEAMRRDVGAVLAGLLAGRRVGVVLTFGSATSADIQRGIRVARLFNEHVLPFVSEQFAGAAYDSYFTGGGDLSKIELKIFVYDS